MSTEEPKMETQELSSLDAVDAELRKYETKLREVEAMEDKEGALAELKQLGGTLETLQGKIDAILTADLKSGKTSAKHYRRAVNARIEALQADVNEVYADIHKNTGRLQHVRDELKAKVKDLDALATRLAEERRNLQAEHAKQLGEVQAEIDTLVREERALVKERCPPCASYRVVAVPPMISPFFVPPFFPTTTLVF